MWLLVNSNYKRLGSAHSIRVYLRVLHSNILQSSIVPFIYSFMRGMAVAAFHLSVYERHGRSCLSCIHWWEEWPWGHTLALARWPWPWHVDQGQVERHGRTCLSFIYFWEAWPSLPFIYSFMRGMAVPAFHLFIYERHCRILEGRPYVPMIYSIMRGMVKC